MLPVVGNLVSNTVIVISFGVSPGWWQRPCLCLAQGRGQRPADDL